MFGSGTVVREWGPGCTVGPMSRPHHLRLLLAAAGTALLGALLGAGCALRMPGSSFTGPLPPLDDAGRERSARLQHHVQVLAGDIGERNLGKDGTLDAAAEHVERAFRDLGYTVESQWLDLYHGEARNLIATRPGSSEIVVVGAHYDTAVGTPGADDNASGVAAMLELARHFAEAEPERTLRFVAFANEEPPFFQSGSWMGSTAYAEACAAAGDDVVAMLSLEMIGYYADERGTQHYPFPFSLLYPSTGNFISVISRTKDRKLVRQVVGRFRETTQFPSEGAAVPGSISGVGWSDHWSFWNAGYPAVMVTDTAFQRNERYHEATDTPDTLDYDRLGRVVGGLVAVVEDLVQ